MDAQPSGRSTVPKRLRALIGPRDFDTPFRPGSADVGRRGTTTVIANFPARIDWRHIGRLAAFGGGWALAVLAVALLHFGVWGFDTRVYWSAWQLGLYDATGPLSGYVYSPAFAQAIFPLTLLPWSVFEYVWWALGLAVYAWLLAPIGPKLRVPLVIACLFPALNGNVEWLVALVLVIGFRYPATWAALLLTKITPGVGLLWFLVRREWRALSVALVATATVTVASFVSAPALWAAWVRVLALQIDAVPSGFVAVGSFSVPLVLRLAVAALIVAWAARTDRAWLLAPAVALANPDLWVASLGVLAAIPRLRRSRAEVARLTRLTPTAQTTS